MAQTALEKLLSYGGERRNIPMNNDKLPRLIYTPVYVSTAELLFGYRYMQNLRKRFETMVKVKENVGDDQLGEHSVPTSRMCLPVE